MSCYLGHRNPTDRSGRLRARRDPSVAAMGAQAV